MNLSALIQDLGEDAELILKSDKWLEEQSQYLSSLLDRYTKEYKAIKAAQSVKRILQNQNMTAVDRSSIDSNQKPGQTIELVKVPELINHIIKKPETTDELLIPTLADEGYDIIQSYLLDRK